MNKRSTLIAWAVAACLSACGGGGSTDSTTPAGSNTAPVANAGPTQSVMTGTTVTLNASASTDANGDALTYQWTLDSKPVGSAAQLSSTTAVMPTLSADLVGSYVLSLIVNDGKTASAVSNVTVTAAVANAAPVANAGAAQSVITGSSVTLDGSASSDVNGDALTYAWVLISKPLGSLAILNNFSDARPNFSADLPGVYVASLIVGDGTLTSVAATVEVTAATANVSPVAGVFPFGGMVMPLGSKINFDGSLSSDANGDALSYSWSLTTKPTGSVSFLSGADTVRPTIILDVAGDYVATLIVSDGISSSVPIGVLVTAGVVNSIPTANAGSPIRVLGRKSVLLDGSNSSDADGDALTYSWSLESRPVGSAAALSAPNSKSPSLDVDLPGSYIASLIVNDGKNSSQASTVNVISVPELAVAFSISPSGSYNFCRISGTFYLSTTGSDNSVWRFNGCRVYGEAGSVLWARIKNNTSASVNITGLYIRADIFGRSFGIDPTSQFLPAGASKDFSVPLWLGVDVTNALAEFSVSGGAAVSAYLGENLALP